MLRVKNLTGQRGNQILFRNLTFSLGAGFCLQILGSNGSGKSSLLKMLVGILAPTGGEIFCDTPLGQAIYIGHQLGIKSDLTPMDNLSWWLKIHRCSDMLSNSDMPSHKISPKKIVPNKISTSTSKTLKSIHSNEILTANITDALNSAGLGRFIHTPSTHLSAGQLKRLALARLTLQSDLVWILDEPMSHLDHAGVQWFQTLLESHLKCGGLAILSTHTQILLDTAFPSQVIHLPYGDCTMHRENEDWVVDL